MSMFTSILGGFLKYSVRITWRKDRHKIFICAAVTVSGLGFSPPDLTHSFEQHHLRGNFPKN